VDHAAALLDQTALLADLAASADPDVPVPTCPDWTLAQLLRHTGRGHRWAATIVRTGEFVNPRDVPGGKPGGDVGEWLRGSAQEVLDAVAEVGAGVPVWTFLGPRPAGWWIPRRLHEATVHRADAAIALGVEYELDPALAVDGIDEWLGLLAHRRTDEGPAGLDPGVTLHLHATDADGEWLIRGGDPVITWERGHAKGDAAVRGRAVDLFLGTLRRTAAVEVLGDAAVWRTWLERTLLVITR
jgi:uncharacterized protein (TIGR03083 family)